MQAPVPAPQSAKRPFPVLVILVVVAAVIMAGVLAFVVVLSNPMPGPTSAGLSGRVSDAVRGTVIAGAKVSASAGPSTTSYTTTTNATGDYSLTVATGHNYTILANATGYRNATEVVSVGLSAIVANLSLQPLVPPQPLRLGVILSLSGALGVFGVNNENGATMARDEINSMGGVLGQSVQMVVLDDQTSPSVAASDANILITQDHVAAIVGAVGSGMCLAVLPIAAANHVFEISGSCTSPTFTNASVNQGWFARTEPSDALQAIVAADYVYSNLSARYAAVIGINNAYGYSTAFDFASNFTRFGGTITGGSPRIVNEVYNGVTSYTTDLEAVLNANPMPRILYVIAYPADGVQLVKDWWAGWSTYPSWQNVSLLFSEGCYDPSFTGPLISAGFDVSLLSGTSPAIYAGIDPPGYMAWALRYQAKFGHAPGLFDANVYDAVYLAALAAQAGGYATGTAIQGHVRSVANPPGTAVGPGEWAKALQLLKAGSGLDYQGASGQLDLDAHGDPRGAYILWRANPNGTFTTTQSFSESFVYGLDPVGPAAVYGSVDPLLAAPASVEARP